MNPLEKAGVLVEALPYIKEFRGATFVIKAGGATLENPELRSDFAESVVLLHWVGISVVVVHGGGKQVNEVLGKLGGVPQFVDGLRVTDELALSAVEMVLAGRLNKEIVGEIGLLGGRAVGLTGKDGGLALAEQTRPELGFVGEVKKWDTSVITRLLPDFIPVVAPLAMGPEGRTLNVNADPFAAGLASALSAEKLVLLTDVPGVLDGTKKLIPTLTRPEAKKLIAQKTIVGGMIPKVENALDALALGVRKVHVVDGRMPHALLLEIFTEEGVGTQFLPA